MDRLSDCYRKPPPNSLEIGGEEIGVSGTAEAFEKALELMDESEEEIRRVLFSEFKARNYVPGSEEDNYMSALWEVFEGFMIRRREEIEMTHEGVPREDILWYPVVDRSRCEGCSSCVEFCSQNVFTFYEGKSHVARPYNCLVGKSSCADFCPDNAISFPNRSELRKRLSKLKEEHGVG